MRRRIEKGPGQLGLRSAMAAKYRERMALSGPELAAHWAGLAERWESGAIMTVYRWQLPAEYRPPADTVDELNAVFEVDLDGSLAPADIDFGYSRWVEQNAEPDPRWSA